MCRKIHKVREGYSIKWESNRLLHDPAWLEITVDRYKLLVVSIQALSKDAEGQRGSSEQTRGADGTSPPPHSEEELTVLPIGHSLCFSWRLKEEEGKSGEEERKWSWSEPDSMLTLLQRPHRLCCISSRFCFSSVRSCRSRSFSLTC